MTSHTPCSDAQFSHQKALNVSRKTGYPLPGHWRIQGGAIGARPPPPPTGSISFIFTYVFAKMCTRQRLAPPNGSAPPQQEFLDPPLQVAERTGYPQKSFFAFIIKNVSVLVAENRYFSKMKYSRLGQV